MRIRERIDGEMPPSDFSAYAFRPGSTKWRAVEDVLIGVVGDPVFGGGAAVALFDRTGYGSYFEMKGFPCGPGGERSRSIGCGSSSPRRRHRMNDLRGASKLIKGKR